MHTSQELALQSLSLSFDDIHNGYLQGRERQIATAVWDWASWHSEGVAPAQDRYYRRYGQLATIERINRVRAWLNLEAI